MQELFGERLSICAKCEKFTLNSANIRVCGECGCMIVLKLRFKEEQCPLEKW